MGYTTEFTGSIAVVPPLNEHEIGYLRRFAAARHMTRDLDPYYCGSDDDVTDSGPDIRNLNEPMAEQPGLWCHWEPLRDGSAIEWNGQEKFYDANEWMDYLIRVFLAPGAQLQSELTDRQDGWYYAPEFSHFTFNHVLDGTIYAQGEEYEDTWEITVAAGTVTAVRTGEDELDIDEDDDDAPAPAEVSAEVPESDKIRAVLRGGPYDGDVGFVLAAAFAGGLERAPGVVYRSGLGAEDGQPEMDETLGAAVFRFQEP